MNSFNKLHTKMLIVALVAAIFACSKGGETPHSLGAGNHPPIIPTSWTLPAWFIDPSNSTGCAADTNTCTSATCGGGGIGPCLTWHEIYDGRFECWGTPAACPRLRQNTTFTFLSNATGTADPIYARWTNENGSVVTVTGQFTAANRIATGTITISAAKNRSTPQLFQVTLPAPTGVYAAGQIIVNTTHASRAWLYSNVAGNTWNLTQPFQPATIPFIFLTSAPAEDDGTWQTGDTVNVFQPTTVNLSDIEPVQVDYKASFNQGTYLTQLDVPNLSGQTFTAPLILGSGVTFVEASSSGRPIQTVGPGALAGAGLNTTLFNFWTTQTIDTWSPNDGAAPTVVAGGAVFNAGSPGCNGCWFDGDIIFGNGGTPVANGAALISNVFVDTGGTIVFNTGNTKVATGNYAGPFVWGPGAMNARSRVFYPAGAGAAAAAFLLKGAVNLNGQTKGCLACPGSATSFGTCNQSLTVAQLDTNAGATSCCTAVGGGGGFCNYGP